MGSNLHQPTLQAANGRTFATVPIALQAILINQQEQILLLNSPTRKQGWQVVSGGLEAGETVQDGTLREVREELGTAVRVRPLGVVHAQSFHYDESVRYMVGIYSLLAYEGGDIVPGDDMAGSEMRWFSLAELQTEPLNRHVTAQPWMLARAVELYRLWREENPPLQPEI